MMNEKRTCTVDLAFVHRYVAPARPGRAPLLLLHGTGGNETDMLSLGKYVAPGAALLSPRGKVSEDGLLRFSRRLREGVLDSEDLKARTHELADFVAAARDAYNLAAPIAVAFSNGANVAAAMLLMRPETLKAAVLMRAILPLDMDKTPDLTGLPVLILSGTSDSVAPPEQGKQLAKILEAAGAIVTFEMLAAGHRITAHDIPIVVEWLSRQD